jgi:hypothetical protein
MLLRSKNRRCHLLYCIIVIGTIGISACAESNRHSEKKSGQVVESSVSNEQSKPSEYIIVLEEDISISSAIGILEKYEAQVIKDLDKNRYLIGLKNDPGIEQLKIDVESSRHIKHVQPNFTYTIQ